MANPTTNYGWVLPTPTDLVTDLPADFDVALQGVDTRLKALNPATTLGDLTYASATANTNTRLAVGTTGQVLAVSGGVPAWTTVSSGGMTLLSTTTLSGASTTIGSIPSGYVNLFLVVRNYLPSTQRDLTMRFNGDAGVDYLSVDSTLSGATLTFNAQNIRLNEDQWTTGTNLINTTIFDYANTTTPKTCHTIGFTTKNSTPNYALTDIRGAWNDTSAITSITLLLASGTFSSGTALLYGVK
jgi:hypothetical protein